MEIASPLQALQAASAMAPGASLRLEFDAPEEAHSYRWALYGERKRTLKALKATMGATMYAQAEAQWHNLAFTVRGTTLTIKRKPVPKQAERVDNAVRPT